MRERRVQDRDQPRVHQELARIVNTQAWDPSSASAWPQTQLAAVFGTIADSTGAVIAGAHVTVSSTNTGLKRVGLTDTKGEYHVAGLPPGMYTVRAEKEKFQTNVLEGIALSSVLR